MGQEQVHPFTAETFSPEAAPIPGSAFDRWALGRLQASTAGARLRFRLWDGFELDASSDTPVATIVFRNRRALFSLLVEPDLNFGEAYMFGAMEVRGDLVGALEQIYRSPGASKPRPWRRWQGENSIGAARENVHRHYDLGNDFYKLWLDRELVYTCAFFPTPDATLEDAQVAKMERVCRKLALRPGERVVEAGCGWGSLALHMARRYGVTVRAFNVSREQITFARARAEAEDLADRVEFVEDDYRNVTGEYDVFVSVGMLEHVGLADYPAFGRVVDRSLTRSGRGLLHFIGRNRPMSLNPWIRKRIFPGAYTPSLTEVFERVLSPWNFSVLDVENLRRHYARTLWHWRQRFEAASGDVAEMFDEVFVRAWRLYLAGSEAAFVVGNMQLFQVLVARGRSNDIPWARSL